eukprot:2294864-Amphidinium_carterae.1
MSDCSLKCSGGYLAIENMPNTQAVNRIDVAIPRENDKPQRLQTARCRIGRSSSLLQTFKVQLFADSTPRFYHLSSESQQLQHLRDSEMTVAQEGIA